MYAFHRFLSGFFVCYVHSFFLSVARSPFLSFVVIFFPFSKGIFMNLIKLVRLSAPIHMHDLSVRCLFPRNFFSLAQNDCIRYVHSKEMLEQRTAWAIHTNVKLSACMKAVLRNGQAGRPTDQHHILFLLMHLMSTAALATASAVALRF